MLSPVRQRFITPASSLRRAFLSTIVPTPVAPAAPLSGIKVLDFSSGLAGPFTTMLLGDLGADIVKIENPATGGDPARRWGSVIEGTAEAESALFVAVNRNKRSLGLDLKREEGRTTARNLVKGADVVVTSWLPSKAKELGLDFKSLKKLNPKIVLCSITGYGHTGPYSDRLASDGILAGESGITFCTGEPDRAPVRPQVAVSDHTTGYYAYGAIMAAILSGRAVEVDVAGFDSQVAALGNVGCSYLNAEMEYTRVGTAHPTVVPYEVFSTKDGCLMIGTGNNSQFQKFTIAIEHPELDSNPQFCTNPLRVQNRQIIVPILREILNKRTTKDWVARFTGKGFPFGAVNNMRETFEHPQTEARQLISEAPHSSLGSVKMVSPAVLYDGGRMKIRRGAPTLGEHSDEILREYRLITSDSDSNTGTSSISVSV